MSAIGTVAPTSVPLGEPVGSARLGSADAARTVGTRADVEIVLPVHNEEAVLAAKVGRLCRYLDERFPFAATITVADNASTDRTWAVAADLARTTPGVRAVRIGRKGRGGALRATWEASTAAVVAYMDVDLSTDLDALLPLVAPLLSGHSDLAIGTRLASGSRVVRGPKRELISRGYNRIVRATLGGRFSDAQCGFKAVRAEAVRALLPLVADDGWFFDTELLVVAQRNGLRIHEVPVDWTDDPDSRVDIVATARADLLGIWRLLHTAVAGSDRAAIPCRHGDGGPNALARVAGVGVVSTIAYLALFLALRPLLGALAANALALVATGAANALAHRWLRPGPVTRLSAPRLRLGLLLATGASLALTTGALLAAQLVGATTLGAQTAAVLLGTAAAAPVRFLAVHRLSLPARTPPERAAPWPSPSPAGKDHP